MRKDFITNFVSREERHYCAVLFAWLVASKKNLYRFLDAIYSGKLEYKDLSNARVYFEYTAIRELIFEAENKKAASELKEKANSFVFTKKGDIQKKKPDLVIHLPDSKELILFEAKFELKFEKEQIIETRNYGEFLKSLSKDQIKKVEVVALGHEYFLQSPFWVKNLWQQDGVNCEKIGWVEVADLMSIGSYYRTEIERGLEYLHSYKPRLHEFINH